jgi:hypothetical protein
MKVAGIDAKGLRNGMLNVHSEEVSHHLSLRQYYLHQVLRVCSQPPCWQHPEDDCVQV